MKTSRGRSRHVLTIGSLLVLGIVSSACGSSTPSAQSGTGVAPAAAGAGAADPAVKALAPPELQSKGTVTFAVSAAHPPNAFYDSSNTLVGWEVELGKALAAKMGLKPDFQKVEFAAIIPGLQSGRYDIGLSGISDNKTRQAVATFVDYFSAGTSLVVQSGNPEHIPSIEELCGHTVAIETGTSQVKFAQDESKACVDKGKPPITVATFPDETQVQLQIRTGRATAGLNDFPVAAYIAQQSGGKLEAVIGGKDFTAPYGLAVPKDSTKLVQAVQAALKSVIADGTYAKILAKWNLQQGSLTTSVINGAVK